MAGPPLLPSRYCPLPQCAAALAAGTALSGFRYVALWVLYAATFATIASTMIAAAKPQPSLFGSCASLLLDIWSLRRNGVRLEW